MLQLYCQSKRVFALECPHYGSRLKDPLWNVAGSRSRGRGLCRILCQQVSEAAKKFHASLLPHSSLARTSHVAPPTYSQDSNADKLLSAKKENRNVFAKQNYKYNSPTGPPVLNLLYGRDTLPARESNPGLVRSSKPAFQCVVYHPLCQRVKYRSFCFKCVSVCRSP